MTGTPRHLYQFPLSLYCEKTTWNLEAKGIAYTAVNLIPGPHMLTAWRLASIRTLPVLLDGNVAVGDSTDIALYLEKTYPSPSLLPSNPEQREAVLSLEQYFDDIGDHVRRCVWSLAVDSPRVNEIFFRGYATRHPVLERLLRPVLRQMIRRTFDVRPARVTESWRQVMNALERIEQRIKENAGGYLVGSSFTLADLTAAAMLAPLIGPEESPWPDHHVTDGNADQRKLFRNRPAGEWVLRMYQQHRHAGRHADRHSSAQALRQEASAATP